MLAEAGYVSSGDWTTALLDVVGDAACGEGAVVCALRDAFDSAVVWAAAIVVCIVPGFLLAVPLVIVSARRERARDAARTARRRLVSGPVHGDGTWARRVEDERGRRVVEVLGDGGWTPSTLSSLTIDVPTIPRPCG